MPTWRACQCATRPGATKLPLAWTLLDVLLATSATIALLPEPPPYPQSCTAYGVSMLQETQSGLLPSALKTPNTHKNTPYYFILKHHPSAVRVLDSLEIARTAMAARTYMVRLPTSRTAPVTMRPLDRQPYVQPHRAWTWVAELSQKQGQHLLVLSDPCRLLRARRLGLMYAPTTGSCVCHAYAHGQPKYAQTLAELISFGELLFAFRPVGIVQ